MSLTPFNVLVGIALILFVVAIIKPAWPLTAVGGILICAALLIGSR